MVILSPGLAAIGFFKTQVVFFLLGSVTTPTVAAELTLSIKTSFLAKGLTLVSSFVPTTLAKRLVTKKFGYE